MNSVVMVALLFFGDVQFVLVFLNGDRKCSVVATTSLAAAKYYAPRIILAYVTLNTPNYAYECDESL
jgi:hypothetical protein